MPLGRDDAGGMHKIGLRYSGVSALHPSLITVHLSCTFEDLTKNREHGAIFFSAGCLF